MSDIEWCYFSGCPKHPSPTGPPKNPEPTYEQLREYRNRLNRWDAQHTKPPAPNVKIAILKLLNAATTTEDYLTAYTLAEQNGMVYWQQSATPQESGYTWL